MIENNLARIADALEALVHKLDHIGCAVAPAVKAPPALDFEFPPAPAAKEAPKAEVKVTPETYGAAGQAPASAHTNSIPVAGDAQAPAPPAPVVKAAPPAPVAKEAPPVVVETTSVMTAEELNASLVEQFKRLGMKQEPIREVMKAMGANSVLDLKPEQYSELLDKVKAL